ncbi:hypothetical protein [Vibrio injensis]|uniref:hypothetical protein n=1 Tax=Vibrio injensis TaxID=1307414 RepID=UPI00278C72C1|nr:hypothetical protein [Vibrio injensis]
MCIIHYKKQCVIFLLMCFSLPLAAISWSDLLRIEMLQTYDDLNEKIKQCRQERKVINRHDINSKWLHDLSREQRGIALLVLNSMAIDKCSEVEESNYTKALLSYVAETGDTKRLDDWLFLKKIFIHKEQQTNFQELDFRQVQILSEKPPFNKPFDPLQVLSLYSE